MRLEKKTMKSNVRTAIGAVLMTFGLGGGYVVAMAPHELTGLSAPLAKGLGIAIAVACLVGAAVILPRRSANNP